MSKILFCWELGAATGHLHLLGSLIQPLHDDGHEVVLASRNVKTAYRMFGHLNIKILPAPHYQEKVQGLQPAANYSEVLFHVGFLDAEGSNAVISSWESLYQLLEPDMIITEHSPSAMIAARMFDVSVIVVGYGFSIPPDDSPMPTLTPWIENDVQRHLNSEKKARLAINQLLEKRGAKPINKIANIFHDYQTFLVTLPEIDHYGERPGVQYWGSSIYTGKDGLPEAVWPNENHEKVFVYLHSGYRQFPGLIKQLSQLSLTTLVVAPEMDKRQAQQMSNSRVKFIDYQVDLKSVSQQCRVIINHASQGTIPNLLLLGKPALMLPNFVEQTTLAWRLAKQSLGLMAHPDPKKHNYKAMIEKLLNSPELYAAAENFAEHYRNKPKSQPLIDGVRKLL